MLFRSDEVTQQLSHTLNNDHKIDNNVERGAIVDNPSSSQAQEPRADGDEHHVQLPHRDLQNYSADGWWKAWFPGNHRRDPGQEVAPPAEENVVAEASGSGANAPPDPRAEHIAELKRKDLQLHRLRMQIADIEKNENPPARPAQLSEIPSHGSDFATPREKQPDLIDLTTPPRVEEEKGGNPKVPTPVPERLRLPGETSAEAEARFLTASRAATPLPPWPSADRTGGDPNDQRDSARHQLKEMRDQMEMITRALKTEPVGDTRITPPPGLPGAGLGLLTSDGQEIGRAHV